MVTNSAIGMAQEVRARRTLDRLSLLVAAPASVERDGVTRPRSPDQVALGDVVRLAPGDQLVAMARCLALVISAWTNRCSRVSPSPRTVGAEVRSGAFVVEGTGADRVSAVGERGSPLASTPSPCPGSPPLTRGAASWVPGTPRVSQAEASGHGVSKGRVRRTNASVVAGATCSSPVRTAGACSAEKVEATAKRRASRAPAYQWRP